MSLYRKCIPRPPQPFTRLPRLLPLPSSHPTPVSEPAPHRVCRVVVTHNAQTGLGLIVCTTRREHASGTDQERGRRCRDRSVSGQSWCGRAQSDAAGSSKQRTTSIPTATYMPEDTISPSSYRPTGVLRVQKLVHKRPRRASARNKYAKYRRKMGEIRPLGCCEPSSTPRSANRTLSSCSCARLCTCSIHPPVHRSKSIFQPVRAPVTLLAPPPPHSSPPTTRIT